eukprot:Selendium_serpulae@DN4619_c0_g1_i1.p1
MSTQNDETKEHSDRAVLQCTMVGASVSGLVGRTLFHPIDTCKAVMQVQKKGNPSQAGGIVTTLRGLQRSGGTFRQLYAGFGVAALGAIPGCCLYFTGYEASKRLISDDRSGDSSPGVDFTAGFLAEALSCLVWVPVDVCKERLQCQEALKVTKYKGSLDCLRTVAFREGIFQLYKGYFATLASFGPLSALYFTFFEALKQRRLRSTRDQRGKDFIKTLRPGETLACGAAAATMSAWLTSPLDLTKVRLQVQRAAAVSVTGNATPFFYGNMVDGLRDLLRTEGLKGAFRGSVARCLFHTPTIAVSMCIMGSIRDLMLSHQYYI